MFHSISKLNVFNMKHNTRHLTSQKEKQPKGLPNTWPQIWRIKAQSSWLIFYSSWWRVIIYISFTLYSNSTTCLALKHSCLYLDSDEEVTLTMSTHRKLPKRAFKIIQPPPNVALLMRLSVSTVLDMTQDIILPHCNHWILTHQSRNCKYA